MRKSHSKIWIAVLSGVVAAGALLAIGVSPFAGQSVKSSESAEEPYSTYTWSAELVAFDPASNMLTVKAVLVSNPEKTDFAALHAGDRAVVTWSGLWTAAGIRAVERGTTSSFDRLTMPVEYVGSELDGRYVSFKLPIPADDAAAIATVKPGAYVTVTSPLRAKTAADVVQSIKPYSNAS
jgi:hypothetical protein